MTPDFEAIEVAVFNQIEAALVAANLGFQVISRNAKIFANLGVEGQPAFQLMPVGGIQERVAPGLFRFRQHYLGLVYAQVPDPTGTTVVPQTILNQARTAIGRAFEPDANNWGPSFTNVGTANLGVMVQDHLYDVFIEGDVTMNPGVITNEAALIIPIWVLAGS